MAARKKAEVAESLGTFNAPGVVRCFAHADGRTYDLQVVDCRVYESWVNARGGGGSQPCTRPSDAEAQAHAWKKAQALLKKGFVESDSRPGRVWAHDADVVDTIRSDLNYAGVPREDLRPTQRPNLFEERSISSWHWLLTSDDRKRGISLRSVVWQNKLPEAEREAMASVLLSVLEARRGEILADTSTPVRKLALETQVGRFTHLAVSSPTTTNHLVNGRFTISRSVFQAFPIFDCELCSTDSVTVAEARTEGHASLPYNHWDRAPHPVFDLAYLKTSQATPEFLVYDPKQLEKRLHAALPTLGVAEVRPRNFRGEELRFVQGPPPMSVAELRHFFGYDA